MNETVKFRVPKQLETRTASPDKRSKLKRLEIENNSIAVKIMIIRLIDNDSTRHQSRFIDTVAWYSR